MNVPNDSRYLVTYNRETSPLQKKTQSISNNNNTLIPGYIFPIAWISDLSKPAITAPPTGTIKFLSVLCTNTSILPTRFA